MNTLAVWLSVGGPILGLLALIGGIYKIVSDRRKDRLAEPKTKVETDSFLVTATKDVVTMIRSELAIAAEERARLTVEIANARNEMVVRDRRIAELEREKKALERKVDRLETKLAVLEGDAR